jgi:hypothetical protein
MMVRIHISNAHTVFGPEIGDIVVHGSKRYVVIAYGEGGTCHVVHATDNPLKAFKHWLNIIPMYVAKKLSLSSTFTTLSVHGLEVEGSIFK